jgi:hypothetical protein
MRTLVAAVAVACVLAVSCGPRIERAPQPECTVDTSIGRFTLDLEQSANAAVVAGTGRRLGMPDHAVTIALATALQESGLRNLSGGDRDSVGLFQQRPSQGWGTPAQLTDPVYASTAFYGALVKVPGWEVMAVADAAQAVQRSGVPEAYTAWEAEGRSLAVALTGEEPAGLGCSFQPSGGALDRGWRVALSAQLGPTAPGTPVDTATGWALASWLVANAHRYGFTTVSFAGQTWRPVPGTWRAGGAKESVVRMG